MDKFIVETQYVKDDIECVTILNVPMGIRCGYIGVGDDNPLYGEREEDLPLCAHGGITYASHFPPRTFDSIQKGRNLYWIGFDTGHFGDYLDDETIQKYSITNGVCTFWGTEGTYLASKENVDAEVELLRLQAIHAKNEDDK
jgi:hypothetical protein